jgi:hypothetical protein
MRAPLFYATCLAIALGMTAFAASPVFDRPGAVVEGAALPGAGFRFDGKALAQLGATQDVAVTRAPGVSGALTGVAVSAMAAFDPAKAHGARLLIGPTTRTALSQSDQTIAMKIKPLPEADRLPASLAVGYVVASSPIQWTTIALTDGGMTSADSSRVLTARLPKPAAPPLALAIHMTGDDMPGLQLLDLALVPSAPQR